MIAPEQYIDIGTNGRINSITNILNDAYKSNKSLIVIGSIERLIEYVSQGQITTTRLCKHYRHFFNAFQPRMPSFRH
jgi:hypothetical protein